MANLTTRSLSVSTVSTDNLNKGSALTISEMDSNFLNLNTDKLENTNGTFTGDLTITSDTSSAVGSVKLLEAADNGTNSITLKAPTALASNLDFILPSDAGSTGYALTTDGAGTLSWTSSAAGDITAVNITAGTGLSGSQNTGSGDHTQTLTIDTAITADVSTAQTLTNKTLTAPIISSISNTGTLTLPTSTDTLVGRDTTDTLTNKSIDADNNTITNLETDNIKAGTLVIEAEGISSNDNDTTIPTSAAVKDYVDTQVATKDTLAELNDVDTTGIANDKILKYNSTSGNWEIADDSGGIALTDLSVGAEGVASGDGSLSYNNTTGEFTYTPPVLSGLSGDTDDISEGSTNLYYTDTRFDTRLATKTTDNLTEGSTNLYYTDTRARAVSIENVVEDTTPQLGGSLDVNGNKIVSVSNGNIDIEPNGTGDVLLGNFVFDADQTVGAGQDNYVLTYDNTSGKISLEAATGGGGGLADVVDDTTPQLGGDLDTNGFELTASATGEIRLGDGADRYATVDLNADRMRLSNISLDLADNLIVTTTTDGDIKLRPNGTGGVRIGDSNTDVDLKTDGGALTIKTTANNADITIEPHGTGVVNMKKYKVESPSLGDLPIFSRTSTNTGATSFQARQNYSTTARAAGQTAGAMNFSNVNDVDTLGTFYVGLVQGEVGDEGTFGSAGENNNAILLKTFVQNSGAFPTNIVGEFRYASAGIMNGNLTFDDTSGVITIEAATANDDLQLKVSGTGDITMNPSGTGYIILNNLPTSSAGLPTGAVWNDSGTLKIA